VHLVGAAFEGARQSCGQPLELGLLAHHDSTGAGLIVQILRRRSSMI
jgi:hypothetical protein